MYPSDVDKIYDNNIHNYVLDTYKDEYAEGLEELYGQDLIVQSMWPGGYYSEPDEYIRTDEYGCNLVTLDNDKVVANNVITRLGENLFYISYSAVADGYRGQSVIFISKGYVAKQCKPGTFLLARSAVYGNREKFHEKIALYQEPSKNNISIKYLYDIDKIINHSCPNYTCKTNFNIYDLKVSDPEIVAQYLY